MPLVRGNTFGRETIVDLLRRVVQNTAGRERRLAEARDQANAAWRRLWIVGGLLNQVATVGNATGDLPPNTAALLERVASATV